MAEHREVTVTSDPKWEVTVTEEVEYKVTVYAPDSHTAGALAVDGVIEDGDKWFHAVTERQSGFTERVDE